MYTETKQEKINRINSTIAIIEEKCEHENFSKFKESIARRIEEFRNTEDEKESEKLFKAIEIAVNTKFRFYK